MLTDRQKQIAEEVVDKRRKEGMSTAGCALAAVEAILAEQARAAEQGQAGSLMDECCEYGYFGEPHDCAKSQPAHSPAGNVLEIESRHSDYGEDAGGYRMLKFGGKYIGRIDNREAADRLLDYVRALTVAREGYVSLEDVEKVYRATCKTEGHPSRVIDFLWHIFRSSLVKPVEQTDEQKVETILINALKKLSTLGNGEHPGNSIGNEIAQKALTDAIRLREEMKAGEQ